MPRITDYMVSQQMLYQLGNVSSNLSQAYQQLSSGQKLTNSSDNPSEVSAIFTDESSLRNNVQYDDNLTRANEVSTSTYSNVSSLKDIVVNAETLATTSQGTGGASVNSANATSVNGLIEEALQLGNAKQNGEYLFSGDTTNTQPFTVTRDASGNVTGVTYSGSSNSSSFSVSDGVKLSPYSTPAQNQQIADVITHLISLRDAMTSNSSSDITTASSSLSTDEDNVINQMSTGANIQSRIQLMQGQIQKSSAATYSTISAKASTDIAQATIQYNAMTNAYQAAITAGAKVMQTSLLTYLT